jgi:hypothetical protein
MTSTMRFDKWENTLGQPYSTVLQVKTSQLASRVSQSIGIGGTGSAFLSVSITPKFINSLLLVQFFVNGSSSDAARYANFGISTFRNSAQIGQGDADGSATRLTSSFWVPASDTASTSHLSGTVVDVPNTTSSITYDIRAVNVNASSAQTIHINGPTRTDIWGSRGISTLIVTEIAQ